MGIRISSKAIALHLHIGVMDVVTVKTHKSVLQASYVWVFSIRPAAGNTHKSRIFRLDRNTAERILK